MPATQSPNRESAARPRQRLYINVDHVATIRQARRTDEPDAVAAAAVCEAAGADGITAHLREDRRHIQDADIERLVREVRTVFNLEMAATDEMVGIAERLRPFQVTLVPERREEVTTEGGLDVAAGSAQLSEVIPRLVAAGVRVSIFIDPDPATVDHVHRLGAHAVELHTGRYAHAASAGARAAAGVTHGCPRGAAPRTGRPCRPWPDRPQRRARGRHRGDRGAQYWPFDRQPVGICGAGRGSSGDAGGDGYRPFVTLYRYLTHTHVAHWPAARPRAGPWRNGRRGVGHEWRCRTIP